MTGREARFVAKVVVYVKSWCPYCHRALALLESKGVQPEVLDVESDPEVYREMIERAGGRPTAPQIFIDGTHVGGCDELVDLDMRGRLDPLL